jgi:hypothetical protein
MHSTLDDIHIAPVDDARQIAQLVNDVWHSQYPKDSNLTIWPEAFFDWQFLHTPKDHPAICLGAYRGQELLGVHCGDIWIGRDTSNIEDRLTFLSCVSVRAGPHRHLASSKLLEAMRRWSDDNGAHQFFGFVNPRESAMVGRKYWMSRTGLSLSFLQGARQWQLLPQEISAVRETACDDLVVDLDRAVKFLSQRLNGSDTETMSRVYWSSSRIEHQLRFKSLADVSQVTDGDDDALCNYSIMQTYGGWNTAYIDFLAASHGRLDLLQAVLNKSLAKMRAKGCERIMILGTPTNRDEDLKAMRFTPCIPSYAPLLATWNTVPFFKPSSKLAMVYR